LGEPEPKIGGKVAPDFDFRFGRRGDKSHWPLKYDECQKR